LRQELVNQGSVKDIFWKFKVTLSL
jgi:hypothetical protein